MEYNLMSGIQKTVTPWFKAKWFKITLTVLGVMAVVLVVLFSQQIGNLLKFFGSKAAVQTSTFVLDGNNFLNNGYSAERYNSVSNTWEPDNSAVIVEPGTNRLIVNPN